MPVPDWLHDLVSPYPARLLRPAPPPRPVLEGGREIHGLRLTNVPGMTWDEVVRSASSVRDGTGYRSVFHPRVAHAVGSLRGTTAEVVQVVLARDRALGALARWGDLMAPPKMVEDHDSARERRTRWQLDDGWDLREVRAWVMESLEQEGAPVAVRCRAADEAIGEHLGQAGRRGLRFGDWLEACVEMHNRAVWCTSWRATIRHPEGWWECVRELQRPDVPRPLDGWDDDLVAQAVSPLTSAERKAYLIGLRGGARVTQAVASGIHSDVHLARIDAVVDLRRDALHAERYWVPVLWGHIRLTLDAPHVPPGPSRRWAHRSPDEVIRRLQDVHGRMVIDGGWDVSEIRAVLQAAEAAGVPGARGVERAWPPKPAPPDPAHWRRYVAGGVSAVAV